MILIILFILFLFYSINYDTFENTIDIPIVIICWNNYFFTKNFINQIKRYDNRIIILDNKSNYKPLLDYYKEIKLELGDRIEIRLLEKNYGHNVYLELRDTLPDIYILSDADLELNMLMPFNFIDILLEISNKYKVYKVGTALNIKDHNNFIECDNYTNGKNIYDWEKQFWDRKIDDKELEMYYADIDTTFCLINNKNYKDNKYEGIRIADNYTVKHLPWYKDYIKNNISQDEIDNWKYNNKSSSILFNCLNL